MKSPPNGEAETKLLKSVTDISETDGAFVVGQDGVIKSSFGTGRSSTGVDVKFRPYAKSVREGKQNVYAAIGTTTGRPTLYFAAPLYAGDNPEPPVIGAVVTRGSMEPIDKLLSNKSKIALLISPQGVVFATNRRDWVGLLAARPTAERLKEIRELKQFGTLFEKSDPGMLPVAVDDGIFLTAMSSTGDEEKGLRLGAVDYITKPISPPVVLTRVQTRLKLKASADFLRDNSAFLEQAVARRTREISATQDVTILALASLAETRGAAHHPHRGQGAVARHRQNRLCRGSGLGIRPFRGSLGPADGLPSAGGGISRRQGNGPSPCGPTRIWWAGAWRSSASRWPT